MIDSDKDAICSHDFICFEIFYDILADYGTRKNIVTVSCDEFREQGGVEEINNLIKTQDSIKLCRFLHYVVEHLKGIWTIRG